MYKKQRIIQLSTPLPGTSGRYTYGYDDTPEGLAGAVAWYEKMQDKETVTGKESYAYDKVTGQDEEGNDIVETLQGSRNVMGPFLSEHTVEDIANPNYAKESRREAINAVLDDDDFKDMMLAWAKANPSDVPPSIRAKIQAAGL